MPRKTKKATEKVVKKKKSGILSKGVNPEDIKSNTVMGRPTKYTATTIKQSYKYIEGGYKKQGHVIPTLEGLCILLGVTNITCYNWAEKYPEFFKVLQDLQRFQKAELINHGLTGKFSSTIVKLILSASHHVNERTEVTSTSADELAKAFMQYVNTIQGIVPGGK